MIRILLCIEEGMVALLLKWILERAGYTVIGQASEGSTAVQLAEARCPDLILMDTHLAIGDGIQAAREIIAQTWCPIVLLSDCPLVADANGTLPGGACDYLQKPFSREQLLQVIDRLIVLFPSARIFNAHQMEVRLP